jgi:hypothetical protein
MGATGAYVRLKRDGKWVNVEIDDFTDEELDAFLTPENGVKWARFLAAFIRDYEEG